MKPISITLIAALCAVSPVFAQDAGMKSGQYMMAVQNGMMKSMQSMKPTDNPDANFVMMMMPHHQAAIDMAKVQLEYGMDPQLRKMAEQIIAAQEKEINEMKKWQSEHGN